MGTYIPHNHSSSIRIIVLLLVVVATLVPAAAETDGIVIEALRINETPPGISVTAGYFNAHNVSDKDRELVMVNSQVYGSIEIHRSITKDGMASMVRQESVAIPAGSTVSFEPGDYHLMLFNPQRRLQSGDQVTLTFRFADQTTLEATAEVQRIRTGQQNSQPDHHSHH